MTPMSSFLCHLSNYSPYQIMEWSRGSPICTQFWIRCTIVVRHLHPYNKYIWQVKWNNTMRFEQLTALTKDYFCDTLGFSGTWISFWSNEDGNQQIDITKLWCSMGSTQRKEPYKCLWGSYLKMRSPIKYLESIVHQHPRGRCSYIVGF
jgi:hypothetical protein